ncbi:MAG: flagellar motor protein MotB, partial [Terriglobales bacterium]
MNRRRRRGSDHPHANHERWLISYADFITLLFAFFVVMYAASRGDQAKVHQLAAAIESAFQQLGVFTPQSTPMPNLDVAPSDTNGGGSQMQLAKLQHRLQGELGPEIAQHRVSLQLTRQGLVIRLEELGFFDSGSDQLQPQALPVLARIATAIAPLPNRVRIEGHTDDVPIHNARFASNWQLSTARATELVQMMIDEYHLAPERLAAAGYAQFHPVASNATAEGRRQNRRVDVVVVSPAAAAAEGMAALDVTGAGPGAATPPPHAESADAPGPAPGEAQPSARGGAGPSAAAPAPHPK